MLYRVIVQKLARADLKEAYDWAAKRAPQTAARWLDRFEQALQSLERQPQSRPLARENKGADVNGVKLVANAFSEKVKKC